MQDAEHQLLWEPSETLKRQSYIAYYMSWLEQETGHRFESYDALWRWSVDESESFWASIWRFFEVKSSSPYTQVLADRSMPGARWFTGARLNYAEHVLRGRSDSRPALIYESELRPLTEVSWAQLERQVAVVAAALRRFGVKPGDRVVAYLPNIPEAIEAALATFSLGAVWSSCSPDFGTSAVVDRFRQIEPKVLFAVDGYQYGGKPQDRRSVVAELQAALPTVTQTVLIPYLDPSVAVPNTVPWPTLQQEPGMISFEQVPFDHPLCILYSSGTTGLPKPIVHGHGGILLEHLKVLALHQNLRAGDRFFWFTTTGWMMWNYLLSGLMLGTTLLLYDGSPGYPDMSKLWRFAEATGMTVFGTSAAFITGCMKAGIEPGRTYDLSRLKNLSSTGSPLSPEGFQWVYDHVRKDLWLSSVSGGTDLCTAFVAGCPLLPVYAGELQCRCLGAKVEAFDATGCPVTDEVGELVITEPLPSMPLFFWNDPKQMRYRDAYFDVYPGIWRHGDWIKVTSRGSAVIYGRSDATINRHGVRMGTSEIYRVVEDLPEVADSLVIDLEGFGGTSYMPLFVVLRDGVTLDESLRVQIGDRLRTALSPRHVPDEILAIRQVPRTFNGKKLEVPVKKILMGVPVTKAANPDSMANPESLQYFVALASQLSRQRS